MATTADFKNGLYFNYEGKPVSIIWFQHVNLYKDDMGYNFMHTETYEQVSIPEEMVENADLMKEGQYVEMMFLADEEKCLTCELPTYVELEVTYTEPAVKGDTASSNALKAATLETGAEIMVPLFINQGDKIRVNTVDRSYGERVKE